MATPTYTPLITVTASGSESSKLVMSSIPQTYTDLILVIQGGTSTGGGLYIRFNGSSESRYGYTKFYGYSSTTGVYRTGSQNKMEIGGSWSVNDCMILQIQDYASTTSCKTVLCRQDDTADTMQVVAGTWQGTSAAPYEAINSITILSDGPNFGSNTTFTLYGIASAAIGAPKAQGGIITYDDTYFYHTFGASGTFTPQQSLTADILVVAGGGGGGVYGGGGGAGGLLGFASQSLSATGYTVTVGAGGAGVTGVNTYGADGGDSQFGALTLVKGGGGGASYNTSTRPSGRNGGSGGGAAGSDVGGNSTGGTATSGQGNAGGNSNGNPGGGTGGGGGGGAGGAGTSTSGNVGVAGGIGVSTYSSYGLVTGTGQNVSGTVYYAGGGGGGNNGTGAGGIGGGGAGDVAGLPNTGGGGGGANATSTSKAGGSGLVIIRYLKA